MTITYDFTRLEKLLDELVTDLNTKLGSQGDVVKELKKLHSKLGPGHRGGGSSPRPPGAGPSGGGGSAGSGGGGSGSLTGGLTGSTKTLSSQLNAANKKIGQMASGAGKATNAFAGFIKNLDSVEPGKMIGGLFKAVGLGTVGTLVGDMTGDALNVYRKAMDVGQTFNGSMMEMAQTAFSAGMGIDDFGKALSKHSVTIGALGTKTFATLNKQVSDTMLQFGNFGMTSDQVSDNFLQYMENQRQMGMMNALNDGKQASAFKDLIVQTTALASLTGKSRQAILDQTAAVTKSVGVWAGLKGASQGAADAMQTVTANFASMGGNAGNMMSQLMGEVMGSPQAALAPTMQAFIQTGMTDVVGAFSTLRQRILQGDKEGADAMSAQIQQQLADTSDGRIQQLNTLKAMGSQEAAQALEAIKEAQAMKNKAMQEGYSNINDYMTSMRKKQEKEQATAAPMTKFLQNFETYMKRFKATFMEGFLKGAEGFFKIFDTVGKGGGPEIFEKLTIIAGKLGEGLGMLLSRMVGEGGLGGGIDKFLDTIINSISNTNAWVDKMASAFDKIFTVLGFVADHFTELVVVIGTLIVATKALKAAMFIKNAVDTFKGPSVGSGGGWGGGSGRPGPGSTGTPHGPGGAPHGAPHAGGGRMARMGRGAKGIIGGAVSSLMSGGLGSMLMDTLMTGGGNVVGALAGSAGTAASGAGAAGGGLAKGLLKGAGKLLGGVAKLAGPIGVVISAGMAVYDAYEGWNDAANILKKDTSQITTGDKIAAAAGNAIDGFTFGITGWISNAFGFDNTAQALAAAKDKMSGAVDWAVDGVSGFAKSAMNVISGFSFSGLMDNMKTNFASVRESLSNIDMSGVAGVVKEFGSTVMTVATAPFRTGADLILQTFAGISFNDAAEKVKGFFSDTTAKAKEWIGDKASAAWEGIKTMGSNIDLTSAVAKVTDFVGNVSGKITSFLSSASSKAWDMVSGLFTFGTAHADEFPGAMAVDAQRKKIQDKIKELEESQKSWYFTEDGRKEDAEKLAQAKAQLAQLGNPQNNTSTSGVPTQPGATVPGATAQTSQEDQAAKQQQFQKEAAETGAREEMLRLQRAVDDKIGELIELQRMFMTSIERNTQDTARNLLAVMTTLQSK